MKDLEKNLKRNISELYNTAQAEIIRKDKMIAQLRKELDDLTFKRKTVYNHDDELLPFHKRPKHEPPSELYSSRVKSRIEFPNNVHRGGDRYSTGRHRSYDNTYYRTRDYNRSSSVNKTYTENQYQESYRHPGYNEEYPKKRNYEQSTSTEKTISNKPAEKIDLIPEDIKVERKIKRDVCAVPIKIEKKIKADEGISLNNLKV